MSPPIEVVLQVFITVQNPSLPAGFAPAKLGSNSKHNDHYTTENSKFQTYFLIVKSDMKVKLSAERERFRHGTQLENHFIKQK
jgi:hypothetical protein